jgi:DNA ligase-1
MSMLVRPMLCELGALSSLELREGDPEWIVERKYDGERIIAQSDEGKVHLWTRRDISVSHKFPEVVSVIEDTLRGKRHSILDGELVVGTGLKDLARRQTEDKLMIEILAKKMPATYMVFDVLLLDGKDVRSSALKERKEMLRSLVKDSPNIAYTPVFDTVGLRGRFDTFVEDGYEGVIMKHFHSAYQVDKRSRDWLKFKKSDTVEVEIIGAVRSEAGQAFKSLIMMREGKYFGLVGTGFTEEDRRRILGMLRRESVDTPFIPLPRSVDPVVLTKPMKALIRLLEISDSGMPRAPVWVDFRT